MAQVLSVPLTARAEDSLPNPVAVRITPAYPPRAALQYRLYPRFVEFLPGDAAAFYIKAVLLYQTQNQAETVTRKNDPKYNERVGDWLEMPVSELPLDEAKVCLQNYRNALNHVHYGSLRQHCQWPLPLNGEARESLISILLPEIQDLRACARLLALEARVALREHRPLEALDSIKAGYALGRHLSSSPLLINGLVGVAIISTMNRELLNVMQDPACPNLYWTITALPQPLADARVAIEFEGDILVNLFPELADVEKAQLTKEQWSAQYLKFITRLRNTSQDLGLGMDAAYWNDIQTNVAATALLPVLYPKARGYLDEVGYSKAKLDGMSMSQTVLTQISVDFRIMRDELYKWQYLPTGESSVGFADMKQEFHKAIRGEVLPLGSMLLPAAERVRMSYVRLERELAILRAIEALRMHAKATGSLPNDWSEVKAVPVPHDPLNGQPFRYHKFEKSALLEALSPAGWNDNRHFRYEITLAEAPAKQQAAASGAILPAPKELKPLVNILEPTKQPPPAVVVQAPEAPAEKPEAPARPATPDKADVKPAAAAAKYHESSSSWNPIAKARAAARQSQSLNNLKQLALAMHNYHDANGSFPAQATVDANGKPLLSWRVYLLPYIEQDALFKQFKLDEPWDSPNNKPLIAKMPELFASALEKKLPAGKTCYLVPNGKEAIFFGDQKTKIQQIADGTSNTIMIVEAAPESAVEWTKPTDWDFDPAAKDPVAGLRGLREAGLLVGFADVSVRLLNNKIDDELLKKFLTSHGGEVIER